MSTNIGVRIDAETLERVGALLAEVPRGAERAFSNAINRGLSKLKTGALREVKRVYTVQSSALNAATNTTVKKRQRAIWPGMSSLQAMKSPCISST